MPSCAMTLGQTYQSNESACQSSFPVSGSKPSTCMEALRTNSTDPFGSFTTVGVLHDSEMSLVFQISLPVVLSRAKRAPLPVRGYWKRSHDRDDSTCIPLPATAPSHRGPRGPCRSFDRRRAGGA